MSEKYFDTLDKKYVVRYEHKPYSRGFIVEGEWAKFLREKIYGIVKRGNKTFYRNYNREIKNGISYIELFNIKYNDALDKLNNALSETVFFNK
jgi:hypothetical protein